MRRSRRPLLTRWGLWLVFAIGPAATGATGALAQPAPAGTPDLAFGDNTLGPGRMLTDFRSRSHDEVRTIALQADGKLVAAGFSTAPNGDYNFALVRYHGTNTGSTTPPPPPTTTPTDGALSVRLSAATVVGGSELTAEVTVASPTQNDVSIELASSRPEIVEVPFSFVTLPGPGVVTFPLITHPVTSATSVQITIKLVDPDSLKPLAVTSTTLTVTP